MTLLQTTPSQSGQSPADQCPTGRLPYEKPALRSISLVADEVLGVGCKSIPTPFAALNSVGCLNSVCSSAGS